MSNLKLDVYDIAKKKVGKCELDAGVFGAEVKEHLFYTAVRYQMAAKRQGTHAVKNRSAVSGGGRKPFKQKGTGRARQGTTRAAQMRSGGVVFGPQVRDHGHKMPKKVRRAALRSALSRRVEESAFTVFDGFALPDMKTKSFAAVMNTFQFDDLLLIVDGRHENIEKASGNLKSVKVLPVEGLNVYDVLNHKNVAATSDAIAGIVQRLGGDRG
jgi:large subunit ribosomal protein L4